ncbi:hypothetical protein [Methylobacterium sp. JK268]
MHQIDTPPTSPRPASGLADRLRLGAMMLTLVLGIPLTLAWFGLVGWGVIRIALAVL